jgi:hypothetical protein
MSVSGLSFRRLSSLLFVVLASMMRTRVGALSLAAALIVAHAASEVSEARQSTIPTGRQEPDISGVWTFATLTPLERPPRFAGRRFITREEAVAWEQEIVRAGDQPLGGVPVIDALWLERGHLATLDGQTVTSLVSDPPDGRVPAVTPGVQARLARRAAAMSRTEGPEDRTLSERCLRSGSGPPMFPSPDANIVQIVQTPDHVVLLTEKFHEARIVSLDSRPPLNATLRSWTGDSRGRWEGNTLIVDTTRFTEKIGLTGRFDENLHLVERLTRTGPDTLLYEVRIDDPTAFTGPWSVTIPMTRTSERLYEFACHEGNYSLPNILSAARALEKAGR